MVDHVADGDSFRGGGLEIRLRGVNAPEQDECFGDESRLWLTDEIEGHRVDVVILGTDQFQRSVADVHLDGLWVNRQLVATGHAFALSGGGDDLRAVEASAREQALGIWGSDICEAHGPTPDIEIVDVFFNPPGEDRNERIALHNAGVSDVDLDGYILRDESSVNRFRFPRMTLAAGAKLEVSTACAGTGADLHWCAAEPVWNNDGDTALLLDGFGRVITVYRYP